MKIKKLSILIILIISLIFFINGCNEGSEINRITTTKTTTIIETTSTSKSVDFFSCEINADCKLVKTKCCTCFTDETDTTAINKKYFEDWINQFDCTQTVCSPCPGVIDPGPQAKCIDNKCVVSEFSDNTITPSTTLTTTTNSSTLTPYISSINPTSGPVNTDVTITGSGFTSKNNVVKFGDTVFVLPSPDGEIITFQVTGEPCQPPLGCAYSPFEPGTYTIFIINGDNQKSNSVTFTVTS